MNITKRIFIIAAVFTCFQPNILKSQIRWTNYPDNPVKNGEIDPEALSIQRPCILFDGTNYLMWYTCVRVFPIGNDMLQLSCMGYATSPDGISWQSVNKVVMGPVLSPTAFDAMHAGHGWVIADNDTFKMWYWGYNPTIGAKGLNSIGYAWSLDGSTWTRVAGPGTLGSVYDSYMTGLPDTLGLSMPCVVKSGSTYHMWYSQSNRIGYARSSDGIHWTTVNGSGQNGAVIDHGPLGSFDYVSASWPAVIKTDEGFMIWYSGYDGIITRIGCSISSDGIQWTRAPGLDATGACFDEDQGIYFEDVSGTCVIRTNSQYKMWYTPENSKIVKLAFSDYTNAIGSDNPALPKIFALEQNFPNPFNPSTQIEYIVKEPCLVHLAVYNVTGQVVKELVNAFRQPGRYSIALNMRETPSGIYYYKIQMGNFQAVRKMVKIE